MDKRADVVFVIDASDSMKPCFEQLKASIKSFVTPFQQQGFESLRLGLLAYRTGADHGQWVNRHSFICGDAPELMKDFYSDDDNVLKKFFTRSGNGFIDTPAFCDCLDRIECYADENTPLALDVAADFPFAPLCFARRSIILFTDEKLEDGVLKEKAIQNNTSDGDTGAFSTIDQVMNKIQERHISLYIFAPESPVLEEISQFDRVVAQCVKDSQDRVDNESSWDGLNFNKILEGIGKEISSSVIQKVSEPDYTPAIYGQNTWPLVSWGKNEGGTSGVIDITHQPEGIVLDTSQPIEWVRATMHWDTPIDLDLHAFFIRYDSSEVCHVYYGNLSNETMFLDHDAGVGNKLDTPDGNDETITITKPDNVKRVLFATKIYAQKGCFSDYKGRVQVTTNVPTEAKINVQMESNERLDWCVIAMLDKSDPEVPILFPINKVIKYEPDVNDPVWINWKKDHPKR